MLKTCLHFISSMILALVLASPAVAQGAVELAGEVKVVRSVANEGIVKETLEAPDRIVPGDQLAFVTKYRNATGEPVDDFIITNEVPRAVLLAETGDFAVSVDGATTFGRIGDLTVRAADGSARAATLADVTHLRWTIASIPPGGTGQVKYYARVR